MSALRRLINKFPVGKQQLETFTRFIGTQKETERLNYEIVSLPLYAVEEIPRLCKKLEMI